MAYCGYLLTYLGDAEEAVDEQVSAMGRGPGSFDTEDHREERSSHEEGRCDDFTFSQLVTCK